MYHKKQVKIPIFGSSLVIVISDEKDKISRIFNDNREKTPYATTYHCPDKKGYEIFGVLLNFNNPTLKITHGTISHEVNHLVSFLCGARDIHLDTENDETQSYLTDWFITEIYKFLKKLDLIKQIEI